jgi:SAM-dependent methyltransferase
MSKQELLIGCGSDRTKRLTIDGTTEWANVTTLDINPMHKPDLEWDLLDMPLPFPDNFFDEIHAYEVLEHTGAQGDYKFFFAQFSEFYRILKAGGHLLVTVPSRHSVWALGDPSHTRILQPESLVFLRQTSYEAVGQTSISDFRGIYKADFDIVWVSDDKETVRFILKAVKPSRIFGVTNEPADDTD